MKQFSTIVNTILACSLIFILLSVGLPNFNVHAAAPTPTVEDAPEPQAATCDSTRSIQVSGVAVVNVTPDRTLIKLGVQSNGRSAKDAQAKNSATNNQVVRALKSQQRTLSPTGTPSNHCMRIMTRSISKAIASITLSRSQCAM